MTKIDTFNLKIEFSLQKLFALGFLLLFFPFGIHSQTGPAFSRPRTVTVSLVLDAGCPGNTQKRSEFFKNLLREVSTAIEKQFPLRLKLINQVDWDCNNAKIAGPTTKPTIDSLLSYLVTSVPQNNADIVIGVTCLKNLEGEDGLSFFQEGYVLVRYFSDKDFFRKVLVHEIYHLFGATHINDSTSIMDRFLKGSKLGDLNRELIMLHLERDFNGIGFPLKKEKMKKAVAIYNDIARYNEKLIPNDLNPFEKRRLSKWLDYENVSSSRLKELQKEYQRLEDVYLCLALLYIELKKYGVAIDQCRKALRIKPDLYEAYNLMGIAQRRMGEPARAIDSYKEALKINPAYCRIYYNLGIAYMKLGDMSRAESAYKKAVAGIPHLADAWNNLGFIYFEQGDLPKAKEYFQKAIIGNPSHPLAHSNLAEVLLQQGELDEAQKNAKRALALNCELPGPHNVMGKISMRQGLFRDAKKEFETAVEVDKSYHKGFYSLGCLYKKQKKYPLAVEYFEKAVEINPGFVAAYAGLGDVFLLRGQFAESEKAFRLAQQKGYNKADLHLNLSYIKIMQKQYADALTEAKAALSINPRMAMAHYNLGIIYLVTRRFKESEAAFKQAVHIKPDFTDAWSGLGDLYFQEKKYEMACSSYLKSLNLDNTNGAVHNNLSVIYYRRGNLKQAHFHLEQAEKLGYPVDVRFKKELY